MGYNPRRHDGLCGCANSRYSWLVAPLCYNGLFMRSFLITPFLLLLVSACGAAADRTGFSAVGTAGDGWAQILRSMGLVETAPAQARVIVVAAQAAGTPADWLGKMEEGAVVVLEGDSPLARELGFEAGKRKIHVRRIRDARAPDLRIQWKEGTECQVFRVPSAARVFATERRSGAPLMAGIVRGRGAALWLAVSPGVEGYERFPYLPQALAELGVRPPFESRRLWAFFDSAFRLNIDPEAQAAVWRKAGVAALQVGAWDYFESDEQGDRYLRDLIAACHRHLIHVYAWLELPHVSTRFWDLHPAWREKTALQKDARIDWRLLMNMANPDCRGAVVAGVRDMLARFDWDGVNLAELYFDGIEGVRKVSEFTPLNGDVRREFRQAHGFDPQELFRGSRDPAKLRTFLDYRADLAARLQEQWIDELEKMRAAKPGLDIVLTHVDDRFDTTMRDAIGADAARVLKQLDHHSMTFIIEDPATVWHLGPKRYTEIARRYAPLTPHQDRVGVDINVVDRGKRAYPTSRQTGVELLQLIHTASESFARVAFYSESTLVERDLPFLAGAAAVVTRADEEAGRLTMESSQGAGVRWNGPAQVDGRPWPAQGDGMVWLPAGRHVIEPAGAAAPAGAVFDFNGTLEGARATPGGIELNYRAEARALALLNFKPLHSLVDGKDVELESIPVAGGRFVVTLPRGAHRVAMSGAGN